jgi:hypothetical protein
VSMPGSCSTAPLNRSKSVPIVARLKLERKTFYTENTKSRADDYFCQWCLGARLSRTVLSGLSPKWVKGVFH